MQNESCDVNTQNVNLRKPLKKFRKAKKSADVSHSLQEDILKTPINPHVHSTRRIIFDENGEIESLYTSDNRDSLSNCIRRAKKRSGYVAFTNICAEDKCTSLKSGIPILEDTYMSYVSEDLPESLREILIKHENDQHLEVAIYSFPNDYETVVKYWYDTFQKIHSLPHQVKVKKKVTEGEQTSCPPQL
ncbi:unnamed protein product [Schistosoma turkestanicum]|nr:unnamed protein product [Schistosoma turkestanicum]